MNFEILQRRRQEEARVGSQSTFSTQMLITPLAVMAARKAFKRDIISKNLEIRAQLVSAHGTQRAQSVACILDTCPHEVLRDLSHCFASSSNKESERSS